MTEHTPGPWSVEPLKRTTGWLIHGPQGESITDGPIWTEHFAAESKANAHLVAAAPDLLAFVKNILADATPGPHARIYETAEQIRSAAEVLIAKARNQ